MGNKTSTVQARLEKDNKLTNKPGTTTRFLGSNANQIRNNQREAASSSQTAGASLAAQNTAQHELTNQKSVITPVNSKSSNMRPRLMASFSMRTFASHPKKKCNPTGLHITKKGEFILIDNNERRVKMFSKLGRLLAEFGETRLKAPWDVTYLSQTSEIAVSDPGDNTIKVFDKTGDFQKEFSGAKHLQEPYGIVQTRDGEILVADKGANCVYVHDKDGFVVDSVKADDAGKTLFSWAQYVTTDASGNIVITDREERCVKAFNRKGEVVFCYKGQDTTDNLDPRGVVVDKLGHVLVADGNKGCVVLLNQQGEYLQQLITSREGLETPSALSIDVDDQLVITDAGSEEIKVFSYLE